MRKTENESVEQVLQRFDELHSKYKFMEYNLNSKKIRYCFFSYKFLNLL